jgi:hypothetical protein
MERVPRCRHPPHPRGPPLHRRRPRLRAPTSLSPAAAAAASPPSIPRTRRLLQFPRGQVALLLVPTPPRYPSFSFSPLTPSCLSFSFSPIPRSRSRRSPLERSLGDAIRGTPVTRADAARGASTSPAATRKSGRYTAEGPPSPPSSTPPPPPSPRSSSTRARRCKTPPDSRISSELTTPADSYAPHSPYGPDTSAIPREIRRARIKAQINSTAKLSKSQDESSLLILSIARGVSETRTLRSLMKADMHAQTIY